MTNIEDGSAEHATHSSGDVRANSGGAFANLTHLPHLPHLPHLTGKDSLGSDLHPTSRNAPREPATVDDLIGSSAASPSEPAPSLRPVEEIANDILTMNDVELYPGCLTDRERARNRLTADVPLLLARLRAAEETLAAVGRLHFPYDCTAAGRKDHETCGQREWCYSCGEDQPWPCTTFQAIRDAVPQPGPRSVLHGPAGDPMTGPTTCLSCGEDWVCAPARLTAVEALVDRIEAESLLPSASGRPVARAVVEDLRAALAEGASR